MTAQHAAAVVLGCAAVLGVVLACVGAARAETALDAQHFVAAASTVPPVLLGAAIIVDQGFTSGAVLTVLTVAVLLVTGPALATTFGRAVAGRRGPEQPGGESR